MLSEYASPPDLAEITLDQRFNGRVEEVLQSHHVRSGEQLETTLHRYVWLCNQQLAQSALDSKTPVQVMKDWHKLKPDLFKKQPYDLPGCDNVIPAARCCGLCVCRSRFGVMQKRKGRRDEG